MGYGKWHGEMEETGCQDANPNHQGMNSDVRPYIFHTELKQKIGKTLKLFYSFSVLNTTTLKKIVDFS